MRIETDAMSVKPYWSIMILLKYYTELQLWGNPMITDSELPYNEPSGFLVWWYQKNTVPLKKIIPIRTLK